MATEKKTTPARPTMKMIADELGISRQLVSIVMRDQPGASDETRQRVKQTARAIGYFPDASAQALRGKRTRRLGIIFSMREQFGVDMVERLFVYAKRKNFTLVLAPLTEQRTEQDAVADLLSQRVEGLCILSADGSGTRFSALPQGLPAVTLMGPTAGVCDFRADDSAGIRLLVDHLVGLGHREILHVSGGVHPNGDQRRQSFKKAMTAHGLTPHIVEGAMTEIGGATAAADILKGALPTAIIAANDHCACGVIGTLRTAGVRVPEDVSVAGYDNSSISSLPYLDMTSVDYGIEELTRRALEKLIQQADAATLNTEGGVYLQAPTLVARTSTAPPRLPSS
ncbi:LacI family DNA-binding transcriptional regulator [Rothia nasisuis]|uniref:LacI family DNA-binding transcriptional regulator n=1 Tax=Rothia nasisuis TaxID=2109647 RepID=UPI001F31BF6D|nr:LacI family DNA-binding transcriptional regulator [Rothia nasisuis]